MSTPKFRVSSESSTLELQVDPSNVLFNLITNMNLFVQVSSAIGSNSPPVLLLHFPLCSSIFSWAKCLLSSVPKGVYFCPMSGVRWAWSKTGGACSNLISDKEEKSYFFWACLPDLEMKVRRAGSPAGVGDSRLDSFPWYRGVSRSRPSASSSKAPIILSYQL